MTQGQGQGPVPAHGMAEDRTRLRCRETGVDQGDADSFLTDQLKPELLVAAAEKAGQGLTLRMQPGYDHSYFFMASFVDDHVAFHATRLKA